MNRAIRIVALLGLAVAACTTPPTQPTSSAAGDPTLNSTAAPAADLCAAVEAHAINVTALSALDPATTTVDQLKVAAADVRSTMFPLLVALRASGTLNSWVEGVESGGFLGLVDAIERLPASATAADVTEALAPFGWPEPLISDQRALLADLQEAACTS